METKHTPGPWRLETRMHVHAITCKPTRPDEHPEICFIEVEPVQFHGESVGSITSRSRTAEELKANAELVARAPELSDMLYALTHLGWSVNKRSLYDEEGVEGWEWLDGQGREIATEIGDWNALPPWPKACQQRVDHNLGRA